MVKKALITVGALSLACAIPSVLPASAAPTQKPTLYCSKTGNTSLSTTGGVDYVRFYWYNNNGAYLGQSYDYSASYFAATPNGAKTAYAYVNWSGKAGTTYSVGCK